VGGYDLVQPRCDFIERGFRTHIREAPVGKPLLRDREALVCTSAVVQVNAGHALDAEIPLGQRMFLIPREP